MSYLIYAMITFTTTIRKFGKLGEKTGWSYIAINEKQAEELNPGCRKSFRVKGQLDHYKLDKTALLPMGEGDFILPLNAAIRKGTGKKAGDKIQVCLDLDKRAPTFSTDFIQCLKDDGRAYDFFKTLPMGHQNYFNNWIQSAKTLNTKTKRITMALIALGAGQGFGEMIRANKKMR